MARRLSQPLRGAAAVVGIGATPYHRRGEATEPETSLCLRAIDAAAADAGIDSREIDGFVSYGGERHSGPMLMHELGTLELRWSTQVWGGGGGGMPGALGLAAAAIATGQAHRVVVHRALAQDSSGRMREVVTTNHLDPQYLRNGVHSAAQIMALRTQRMLEVDGVPPSAMRAVALASYAHAQNNPDAVAWRKPLDEAAYDASRLVSEPLRLYDCSRENDAAVALILTSTEAALDMRDDPAVVLAAPMGSSIGWGEIVESVSPYTSAGFSAVARRLWQEADLGPSDVDVAQVYTNFTGPAVAALIDHGFCIAETAGEFCTVENLTAPSGRLPINTSGGDLAEGFVHGMGLVAEAVRQIRGSSTNQVPAARVSLVTGGPGSRLVSSALLASKDTL